MREQSLVADMSDVGFGRIVNMALRAALGKELRTAYSASKESRRLTAATPPARAPVMLSSEHRHTQGLRRLLLSRTDGSHPSSITCNGRP
jgi:hypothetical protein